MCDYFFDEGHGIAYKVNPVMASVVRDGGDGAPRGLLLHTDVKVTNVRKEKIRRTLSEIFPGDYDLDEAKKVFYNSTVTRFISGARRISAEEYETINSRYEMQ